MPLTLVLGPANAAKAGEVLGAYAAAAPRGALLVVPTAADAAHYTAELAGDGALLGSVLTPEGLFAEVARRAGFAAARLGEHGRAWVIERTLAHARLQRLAAAAATPGFREATGALVAELARWLVSPARFARAVREWAGGEEARGGFAEEVIALVGGYARTLERTGRLDDEAFAHRALDALRADPGRWGATPVFLYGFDDLDPLQRDAVEALATRCGVEVTVSLTYEAGRLALAARAEAVEALRPLATRVLELPPLDEHYAKGARGVLHHLERTLFEPGAGRADAGDTVRLLEAGGARAEAELLAGEVAELITAGVAPDAIALVFRSPATEAPALLRVLESYGIPYAVEHRLALGHTAFGRALLALVRCAWEDASSVPVAELLELLRAPGVLGVERADAVEAVLLRSGVRTLAQARERLARANSGAGGAAGALAAIDALGGEGPPVCALAEATRWLLEAGRQGRAPVLEPGEERDALACTSTLEALRELGELEPDIGRAALARALARVSVPAGAPVRPGAVLVSDPFQVRARRFRAVLVGGLVEGSFPRGGAPEPFLSDETRWELALASGLRLRPREDALARERTLLYACVSRATERLVLSFRSSDEEGNLVLPSPFLRDVADRLDTGWWVRRRRRLLADVTWTEALAPNERERARARAAAAEAATGAAGSEPAERVLTAAALAHVRHTQTVSAGALETFADCPVKWLVDRQLQPEPLEPESEAIARGSYMHDTLERVMRRLDGPLTEATLPRALALLGSVLGELPEAIAAGSPAGVRAGARRLIEADLRRYLEHEARCGTGWRTTHLEQGFGTPSREGELHAPAPPLVLKGDEGSIEVRGVIDRVDVAPDGRRALVRDYKSGSPRPAYQGTKWAGERLLQIPLYMLAVRELLGLEPVGGFYQPLRGDELRPRGAYVGGVEGGELFGGDCRPPEEFEALLDDARARAVALAARLRGGRVTPTPETCSRDGCLHPGICRSA